MSQESYEEIYKRIKKRLADYRYRSGFFSGVAMIFAVLFILSLFPVVPATIIGYVGTVYTYLMIPLWVLCAGIFGTLFWVFERVTTSLEQKRGIVLEERMYVQAYEALCFLNEYVDPAHPILGSRTKAIRRLQNIKDLLESLRFPDTSITRQEVAQMWVLRDNLRNKIIPSLKNMRQSDTKSIEVIRSNATELVDYLSKPVLTELVALNAKMAPLPEITERNIIEDFKMAISRRSNLRHAVVFSVFVILASLVSWIDISHLGATMKDAYELGLMFFLGIAAIYVTYLGLALRREPRT